MSLPDPPSTVRGDRPLTRAGISRLGGLLAGLDRLDVILGLPEYPTLADPGVAFGRFRLRARVGTGAYGVVLVADDPAVGGRRVAVKLPQPVVLTDPAAGERFVREARAAGGLDHPGIVPVYEAGVEGGLPFLVSRFVDGPTLATWLADRDAPVPPADAARLVASVAAAVQHAHERGVLHCDLKPANVLLHLPPDGPPQPAVTDFGLARILTDDPAQTRTLNRIGTPRYMAPEQARGDRRALTARADVYALGVILFELLVGRRPVADDGSKGGHAVPAFDWPPAVPADLQAIGRRCLEPEPGERYPSAGAAADDLDRYVRGEPVSARPQGAFSRGVRWAKRNPTAAAGIAALVVLLVGLTAVLIQWWADGVRHAADLRVETAEREEAEERAGAAEFVNAIERVRQRRMSLAPDWTSANLADMRRLAASAHVADHQPALRTETAAALGGFDLGVPRVMAAGFKAYSPVFSPDGKQLALGGWGADSPGVCQVKLIDVATGAEARTLTYRTDPAWEERYGWSNSDGCRAIAWSPDGQWLVVGTRSGRLVRWDLSHPDHPPAVWSHSAPGLKPGDEHLRVMEFTPNGKVLVTFGHNNVAGWHVSNGWKEVFRKAGGGGYLTRRARASDPVRFTWEMGQPRCLVREAPPWLREIDATVLHAIGPRAERAAGPMADWCVNLWPTFQHLHLFRGAEPQPAAAFRLPGEDLAEERDITDVVVNPSGSLVVSASEHGHHLKVWSVSSGELVASQTLDGGSARVAFDPVGHTLAVTTGQCTMLYDIRQRGISETVGSGMVPLADADLTPDDRVGVSVTYELKYGPPVRFDSRDPAGRPRQTAGDPGDTDIGDNSSVVAVDPNDRWVCSLVGVRCRVQYFSDAARRFDFQERSLRDLRADPLGRLWSTGALGIRRWDFDDRTLGGVELRPAVTIGRDGGAMADCIAPGRADVWAGRTDGAVCRYTATGGAADRVFPAFAVGVKGIARSGDGTRVLAGSVTGGVKLFDTESGRVVVDLPAAHRDAVRGLAFLPGGGFVTGGSDRVVKIWDQRGQLVLSLPQTRPVRRVYMSADGRYLTLLAEGERSLRRWDLGALTATFREFGLEPGLR